MEKHLKTRRGIAPHFYPGDCAGQIEEFLLAFQPPAEPAQPIGGIVPHAGWTFSGAVAAKVIASLRPARPDAFVIFGAVHQWGVSEGAVYPAGAWNTPLGPVEIDSDLATLLLDACPDYLQPDADAHSREHSIEVQVPMIKYLHPRARIVPIAMPPSPNAAAAGAAVGAALAQSGRRVAVLGSTDLTHYGRNYDFAPWGGGEEALQKMRQNDRRFIDLALQFRAGEVVAEARANSNACGSGAAAAVIAAATALGATKATLVEYTTSHDVMREPPRTFDMAVGYAGILFGK